MRNAVLNALADAGHRILVSMLDVGEWQVAGNELIIKLAASAAVIDMSLGADAKRLAIATASGVLGRAVKLKVFRAERRKPQRRVRRRTVAAVAAPSRNRLCAACRRNLGRRFGRLLIIARSGRFM